MDDRIKEPTVHQKRLAKTLRMLADAIDIGEVKQSVVVVHYGQMSIQADFGNGSFQIQRKTTGKRLVSIALLYDIDIPKDMLSTIAQQEGLT